MARRPAIRWDEDPVKEAAYRALEKRMLSAVLHVEGAVKKLLSRTQPRKITTSKAWIRVGSTRSRLTSVRRYRGLDPSKPGEPPKMVTRLLRASITHGVVKEPGSIIGIVGVLKGPATKYARRLELGFVGRDKRGRMFTQLPRPYLRAGLVEEHATVVKLLNRE